MAAMLKKQYNYPTGAEFSKATVLILKRRGARMQNASIARSGRHFKGREEGETQAE